MKRKFKIRVIAALIVMLAASINVDAQIGGAIKKAQNAVKKTEKDVTDNERAVKSTERSIKNTERSVKSTEKVVTGGEKTANDAAKQKAPTVATQTATSPAAEAATAQPTAAATQAAAAPQQQGGKPSAEAIAADPRASVTTVEEGYTKSPAEIRAAYEKLTELNFFFPYYHPTLKKYYYLDDSPEELEFFSKAGKSLDAHRSKSRWQTAYYEPYNTIRGAGLDSYHPSPNYISVTIPAGNRDLWGCIDDCTGIMPEGLHVIFAGYALFLADPEGLKPFMRLCEATNATNAYIGSINITGGSDGRTLSSRPEKLTLKWTDVNHFMLSKVSSPIFEASKKTPMSVIKDAATYYKNEVAKYDAAKNAINTRYYFHLFEMAMYYWYTSDKKSELATEMDALFVELIRYSKRYKEWVDASKLDAPPIEMPKTYTMSAALAAKALEVAKSQFENRREEPFKVDRIVFLTDKWSEAREANFPNRVVMRTIQVGVLTNQDGKWVIRQWTLQQDSDLKGGFVETYRYVAGDNYQPKPVNYKP